MEEGLQVRNRKKRRRSAVSRQPLLLPTEAGQRWSMDFMADQLSSGRRIRLFNVIDDFTRQCLTITVDTSLPGCRVASELDRLVELKGKPQAIVCDNGTEYTSKVMFDWARRHKIELRFIEPGKPFQNALLNHSMGDYAMNV